MTKSVEIPQDIINSIIAEVSDTSLLKQCSLVSSSFLLPSRKQLFSRITLKNDQTCQGIYRFLVQNPVIQPFVRAITVTLMDNWSVKFPQWMNGTSLPAILRLPFGRLECFSIDLRMRLWSWNRFSSELKDAISNIIHSSNLKTLSLEGITEVPITFFLNFVRFTELELHSLAPNDFGDENSNSLADLRRGVAPMAALAVAPHRVFDRCVWRWWEAFEDLVYGTRISSPAYLSLIWRRSHSVDIPAIHVPPTRL